MGEKTRETLKLQFDKRLRLEFHGARIIIGVSFPDFTFGVDNGHREETRPVEIDIRIELINQLGAPLGDISISQLFAHHGAILGLHKAVIIGVSGPGFSEADQHLVQQPGYYMVYKLRPIIGMNRDFPYRL